MRVIGPRAHAQTREHVRHTHPNDYPHALTCAYYQVDFNTNGFHAVLHTAGEPPFYIDPIAGGAALPTLYKAYIKGQGAVGLSRGAAEHPLRNERVIDVSR